MLKKAYAFLPALRRRSAATSAIVERGIIGHAAAYLPPKTGKVFVVTTRDVWQHAGDTVSRGAGWGAARDSAPARRGGSEARLAPVEALAEEMVARGADRTSMVIAYGGGIVNDMGGFLAAIFMRGLPIDPDPDDAVAGSRWTPRWAGRPGSILVSGKNLIGSFHQPLAVLTDPAILDSLPERRIPRGAVGDRQGRFHSGELRSSTT